MKFALLVVAMSQPIQVPADVCQDLAEQSSTIQRLKGEAQSYCIQAETQQPLSDVTINIKQYNIEQAGSDESEEDDDSQQDVEASR